MTMHQSKEDRVRTVKFANRLTKKGHQIEAYLTDCFVGPFDAPDIIVSAMKYSLFAGGKRVRPILLMETCAMFGGDERVAIPFACAIEMIHTYSLIHDDLPAMDNDDLRRGEPTNHKVYGENIAILAGDALLNTAVETAVEGIETMEPAESARGIAALSLLMRAAGVNGMIGGQTGDLLAEDDDAINEDKIVYIHAHKTGALLTAAVLIGAVLAGASEDEQQALRNYGSAIGMAFQVVDDILDVESETAVLGKPVGSDAEESKTTFVSLFGLESAKVKAEEYHQEAIAALAGIQRDTIFLEEMADFICRRNR